jgi:small neutral amino acid transporter SnatA (MarC family)
MLRGKNTVLRILNLKNLIGVLLFAIGGYIGGEMLYYALWHYSTPEFSLAGAVFGVCIALGYLMLKGEEKTSQEVELSEIT